MLQEGIELRWAKRFAHAETVFRDVASRAEAVGENDCLADALGWLAVVVELADSNDAAAPAVLELRERALSIDIATHGDRHPRVAESLRGVGSSFAAIGRTDDAIETLTRAAEIFRASGTRSLSAEDALARLVILLGATDARTQRVEFARELVSVCEGLASPTRLTMAHLSLGQALVVAGEPEEALEHFARVLSLAAERISEGHALRLVAEVEEWSARARAMAGEGHP